MFSTVRPHHNLFHAILAIPLIRRPSHSPCHNPHCALQGLTAFIPHPLGRPAFRSPASFSSPTMRPLPLSSLQSISPVIPKCILSHIPVFWCGGGVFFFGPPVPAAPFERIPTCLLCDVAPRMSFGSWPTRCRTMWTKSSSATDWGASRKMKENEHTKNFQNYKPRNTT